MSHDTWAGEYGFVTFRLNKGDRVLVEGANAAMLDIDFGKNTLSVELT